MSDGHSDHDPASDPPGAVSNQNREENQSGHRDDETHPEPRTGGGPAKDGEPRTGGGPAEDGEPRTGGRPAKDGEPRDPSSGAAGEGSQSTGHRLNAG